MKNPLLISVICIFCFLIASPSFAQKRSDSTKSEKHFKNTIRYNISNALIFGFDRYIVIGYERVINKNQSISINFGKAGLPKLVSIDTDSFSLQQDRKNTGYNISVDYRFYLKKENKFQAPRGVYIGPFYSFTHFERENSWTFHKGSSPDKEAITNMNFNIHTIGAELGYQFVFWNRLALDLVLIGPGMGFYNLKASFDSNLTAAEEEQLKEGLHDLITQKFPGMNYVFADEEFNANGVMKTTTIGFRYLIHIGFRF